MKFIKNVHQARLAGLIAVFGSVFSVSVASGASLPDPLIWWDMESVANGKISDRSGNGYHLTLEPGAVLTNRCGGATGNDLFFNGGKTSCASFQCPAMASRTLSFWFRRGKGSGELTYDEGNTYPYLMTDISSFRIHFSNKADEPYNISVFAQNAKQAARYFVSGTTPAFWRESWTHLAITLDVKSEEEAVLDGGEKAIISHVAFKSYVNGACVAAPSTDFVITNLAVAGTSWIGNFSRNYTRPIHGALDELRIWNEALNSDQISAEYERGKAGYGDALIGRWTFDDAETVNGKLVMKDVVGLADDIVCGTGISVTNAGMEGSCAYCDGTKNSSGKFSLPSVPVNNGLTWTCWINQSPDSWKNSQIKTGSSNTSPRILDCARFCCIHLKGALQNEVDSQYVNLINYSGNIANGAGASATYGRATQGAWSHLAVATRFFVNASGKRCYVAKIYMNGELAATNSREDVGEATTQDTWYFANNSSTIRPFEGFVDDLRLYAGELSSNAIVRLFRGAAAVHAGDDFSVAGATAELHGEVGVSAPDGIRTGYAGTPRWTLVDAPSGGEGAKILQPERMVTTVTLPVEGAYVFRLSNVLEDAGLSCHDDVIVTRIAEAGVAPELSLAASSVSGEVDIPVVLSAVTSEGARVHWLKVAGPGGVWFDRENAAETKVRFGSAGTYTVRCMAEKEGASATADVTVDVSSSDEGGDIASGLIGWWPLAGADMLLDRKMDGSYRTSVTTNASGEVWAMFDEGIAGYAFRPNGFGAYFPLGDVLAETRSSSDSNSPPSERYRAISAWVYHDPADTNDSKYAVIFMAPFTLGLWYNKDCSDGTVDGLTLYQQGWPTASGTGIGTMRRRYPLPYSFAGRWTHVYALFDRSQGTDFEVWIDGIKQTPADNSTRRGRVMRISYVGGIPYDASSQENGYWKRADTTEDVRMSRCFPGKIADLRIYNRKLMSREIKMLAANPDLSANRAPAIDALGKSMVKTSKCVPKAVAAVAFDDGEPADGSLAYSWSIISGDVSRAEFGDASARETTFTASKSGVYVIQLAVSDGERTTYSEPLTLEVVAGMKISVR